MRLLVLGILLLMGFAIGQGDEALSVDANDSPSQVVSVFPITTVPENLLRLYVDFSKPMSVIEQFHLFDHIHLLDEQGEAIPDAFYEISLWSNNRTRLTIYLNPGRQKLGLRPNREMGRVLTAGQEVTLVIDKQMRDSFDQPLKQSWQHTWKVGPEVKTRLEPATWELKAPTSDTLEQLHIHPKSHLDLVASQEKLVLQDSNNQHVSGAFKLSDNYLLTFTPDSIWRAGTYRIAIPENFEDICGNTVARAFERPANSPLRAGSQWISFTIE